MRVVFMGTPDFSVPALEALVAAGHEMACVYTQPPRPAGRGKKERASPVQACAEALGLPVRHPLSLRTPEAQAEFAAGWALERRFEPKMEDADRDAKYDRWKKAVEATMMVV